MRNQMMGWTRRFGAGSPREEYPRLGYQHQGLKTAFPRSFWRAVQPEVEAAVRECLPIPRRRTMVEFAPKRRAWIPGD